MIDLLPAAPLRSQGPEAFDAAAEPFVAALPPMVEQINAATAEIEANTTAAAASAASALDSKNTATMGTAYKGLWTALTGALNMPASVYHVGYYWALNANLANVTLAEPGVSGSWQKIKAGADILQYADRDSLASMHRADGDFAQVMGLGMFTWVNGSVLQADKENVFTTMGGQWLLINSDPELAYTALLADVDELWDAVGPYASTLSATQATANSAQTAINTLNGKLLRGSFSMSLTSLVTITSSSFTATVTGAAVGDSVIVNPGNAFGATAADQGRLSYVAYASAANTVTVTIRNASANVAYMTASTWRVLVIKQ